MKILSHRGYWKSPKEKNTRIAFERSFNRGFGTETDLRDHNSKVVICHDMPMGNEITLEEFLDIANDFKYKEHNLTLALNIKSDGLQDEVSAIMAQYSGMDYFLFDMSVPDMRIYIENNLPTYTRISDIEKKPVYLSESKGIWLDNFSKTVWFNKNELLRLLSIKKVCVVSLELHNNDPKPLWDMLFSLRKNKNLSLCTDIPEKAKKFFSSTN